MYSRCGSIEDACQVFDDMVERDVITWNATIGGYVQHQYAREVLDLFEWMLKEGSGQIQSRLLVCYLLNRRAGFVTERRHFCTSLLQDHRIVLTMERYGCTVDLLGRAGQLDEAEQFIGSMPLEETATIWSCLLGACKIHGNLEIAGRASARSLPIDPHNGALYVQLSHTYAGADMWGNVAEVRKVMEDRGYTWI